MVRPHIGNPAGKWAIHDGVVAVLTYFNGNIQGKEPDGYLCMLLVNTTRDERIIEIGLSVTYSGDAFFDHLRFRETLAPGLVVERECYREQLKRATWAMASLHDPESGRLMARLEFKAMGQRAIAEYARDPSRMVDIPVPNANSRRRLEERKKEAAALPPYEPDSLTVIKENFDHYEEYRRARERTRPEG